MNISRYIVPGLLLVLLPMTACQTISSLAENSNDSTADSISLSEHGYDGSPIAEALMRGDDAVDRIISIKDSQRTFDNTIGAIDDIIAQLEIDANMTMFLTYVSTDADERERGQQAEEEFTNWMIELGKNEEVYNAVVAYASKKMPLQGEQKRLLAHTLRDYRRAGMSLPAAERNELKAVQKEVNRLGIQFERTIREDETRVSLTREELPGMPEDYFGQLDTIGDVYLISMSYPQFLPIMDYCDNELTRKRVWIAYKRRGGQKNARLIEQIVGLRAQAASMLGYAHPADYETEVRMSKNAQTVMDFYRDLRPLVRRKAEKDWAEFVQTKRNHTGDSNAQFYPWDYSYYLNRLKKEKYNVDAERIREYFSLDNVIDGLFSVTQSLYGLDYRDITEKANSDGRTIWHEDVRVYEVWDTGTGSMLGEFYLDLHPREAKYGHAAQWGMQQHKIWSNGAVNKPVAALVCNFTKPTATKPSLMTHDEVETFFHEFGHCLHTILSEAHYWQFAGTSVERDFVEAPSQMFENWVWDADVLRTFARHYETGETFPDYLLEGMVKARYLGSGMSAERQFYYGLFDMHCHLDATGDIDSTQLAMDLWDPAKDNVELYTPVEHTHFHAAFGHLVGYQAGYYGYQWSLVYASDMFQRFKELGMLDPEAGMYYRKKILARGGTKDGLDLVRDYLGREPDMNAYLKHLGLETED